MGKKFISISGAIQLTTLSRATINRLIFVGELPSYKIGKRRLFDQQELIEWVQRHKSFEMKNIGKKLTALEVALNDEQKMQDLTFQEKMRLYVLLNRSMNRQFRNMGSGIKSLFESAGLSEPQQENTPNSFSKSSAQEPG